MQLHAADAHDYIYHIYFRSRREYIEEHLAQLKNDPRYTITQGNSYAYHLGVHWNHMVQSLAAAAVAAAVAVAVAVVVAAAAAVATFS